MDNGLPPAEKRPTSRPAGSGAAAKGGSADPRKEAAAAAPGAAKRKNPGHNGAGTRSHTTGATKPVAKAAPRITKSGDSTAPKGLVTPKVERSSPITVAEPDADTVPTNGSTASSFPLLLPKIVEAEPATAPPPSPAAKAPAPATAPARPATPAPAGKAPDQKTPAVEPSSAPGTQPTPVTPKPAPALPALPAVAPAAPTTVALPLPVAVPAEFTDTDGTDGLPSLRRPKRPPRALRAPVVRPKRAARVRRVTRVVRHVDSWSVFKVALVFNLFLYGVLLTAGVLLWQVAQNTGTVDNIERFFESFGWEQFQLKGGEIYHNAWVAGLFVVVGLTGLAVLMATLFNLITDLVGGIRVSVLEEEVIAREDRGLGWRRGSRPTVATPAGNSRPEPSADESQPG